MASSIPGGSNVTFSCSDPEFGIKVVRMTITANCPSRLAENIRTGLKDMAFLSFEYDLVDKGKYFSILEDLLNI